MDESQYGMRIKRLRIDNGLTQAEVAKALDVTPGYICNVENGRTAMSLRMLIYYARLLNVSLDSLVGELEPNYRPISQNNKLSELLSEFTEEEIDNLIRTIMIWKK